MRTSNLRFSTQQVGLGLFGSGFLCAIRAVRPELWRWPLNIDNDGSPALQWVGMWNERTTQDHFLPTFFLLRSQRAAVVSISFPSFSGAQVLLRPGLSITCNNTSTPAPLMTLAEMALLPGTRALSGSHRLCAGVTVRATAFPPSVVMKPTYRPT